MGAQRARHPPHRAKGRGGSDRPPLDVIVMYSWGDWIHGGPNPETSGPQTLQIIGALDALLQSTLSGKTERVLL